jgi:hypothetical protein
MPEWSVVGIWGAVAVGTGAADGRYGTAAWAGHRSSKLWVWPVVSVIWAAVDMPEWSVVGVWAAGVPALINAAATVSVIDRPLMRRSSILKERFSTFNSSGVE